MYTLKHENGILLSFDTYNRIFHQFSDPQSDGIGFGGDYEFYVMEHTSDHIVLKGKRPIREWNCIGYLQMYLGANICPKSIRWRLW